MRRNTAEKRRINPDTKYQDVFIRKLINNMMEKGKLIKAENICYDALEKAAAEMKEEVTDFFHKAVGNASPTKTIVPRRYGGTTYSIPKPIEEEKRPLLAVKIIARIAKAAVRKTGKPIRDCLFNTLMSARKNEGEVAEHLGNLRRTIQENEAFSHLL